MAGDRNFLFVSDLHLSEGLNPETGWLSRNEDFFLDNAFARFLVFHAAKMVNPSAPTHYQQVPWTLVINGDIFDFLQVVTLPAEGAELREVKGLDSYEELKEKHASEFKYGLGTRSPEIVWKLKKVAAGHPVFFQALAWFVAHEGNQLVLMKGNHDIEIFWPDVQRTMRELLVASYADWRAGVADHPWPLPDHAGLPAALDRDGLETAVLFPDLFFLEPGLFFAEHGCQYDPVNSFTNFRDPRLPHKPDLVELPSGSFFVRYFFNKVEEIHPFADNIKPIVKYINWVINNAPSAVVRVLVDLLPRYLVALVKMKWKQTKDWWRRVRGEAHVPVADMESAVGRFEVKLLAIQAEIRRRLDWASRWSYVGTLASLLFRGVSLFFVLLAIRSFINSQYWQLVAFLAVSAGTGFIGSYLVRLLDEVLESNYLQEAAVRIARVLNDMPELGNVQFHVYGHDHSAAIFPLDRDEHSGYRKWYVNTGAWIPVFKDEDRLLREDIQLTFLRLVPQRPGFRQSPPELLQWDVDADRPRSIRIFEKDLKKRKG